VYERLKTYTAQLAQGLREAAAQAGVTVCVNHIGSMLTAFFQAGPVATYTEAARSDTAAFAVWFQGLLARGVYWAPSQFESIFVSGAHGETELQATLQAARAAFAEVKAAGTQAASVPNSPTDDGPAQNIEVSG
jgi:glutamate-1-semialdehyde 2,1-aminomutase